MVAQPPMFALLAIWLRPLTWLPPKKEIARPPMVGLLAIWLRSLTMVASVNLATTIKDGCAENGPNTDHTWESIGDTDHTWKSIGDKDRHVSRLTWLPQKNGCVTSYGCALKRASALSTAIRDSQLPRLTS